jgi:predicted nuclease of predicted toxin-antitoxin system
MKIVIDMNIPPTWVSVFEAAGYEAVHWSTVGDIKAKDTTIMAWAVSNGYLVFTHDFLVRCWQYRKLIHQASFKLGLRMFSLTNWAKQY